MGMKVTKTVWCSAGATTAAWSRRGGSVGRNWLLLSLLGGIYPKIIFTG